MKTAKELGITSKQRRNIAKLALFVKGATTLSKFDIELYHTETEYPSKATYGCGTSACFCGYGPAAGVKGKKGEGWFDYACRAFAGNLGFEEGVYDLLFEVGHKNSRTAAVRRAAWFLEHGMPDRDEATPLFDWEAPRWFSPDWEAIQKIAEG